VVVLLLSLAWTIFAQSQMGESWRIGIDQKHRTDLVHGGVSVTGEVLTPVATKRLRDKTW
jgi:hypothetical protein